jgi:hypothetical protein
VPLLRMRMTLHVGQSGLPAASPESIESVELDSEEKPSRCSILKDKNECIVIYADANIWSYSRESFQNFADHSFSYFCLHVSGSLAQDFDMGLFLRSAMAFWKRFSISVLRFPKLHTLSGTEYQGSIVRINVFTALSSRFSERHNTTSSSLQISQPQDELRE